VGATLEIELPDGLIARRSWPAHPGCGCHWPPRAEGSHPPSAGVDANVTEALPGDRAADPGVGPHRAAAVSLAGARGQHLPETMGS
jgi:hypothetical protein